MRIAGVPKLQRPSLIFYALGAAWPPVCVYITMHCFFGSGRGPPRILVGHPNPGQNRNLPIVLTRQPTRHVHEVRVGSHPSESHGRCTMPTPPGSSTPGLLQFAGSLVCCHGRTHIIWVPAFWLLPPKHQGSRFNVDLSALSLLLPYPTALQFHVKHSR